MLIPLFPQFFRGIRDKPLGVAYASFSTENDAKFAIEKLNGITFKFRKLKVRTHHPYAPKNRLTRFPSRVSSAGNNISGGDEQPKNDENVEKGKLDANPEVNGDSNDLALNKEKKAQEAPASANEHPTGNGDGDGDVKFSTNTIFVKDLRHKVTREKLLEFFHQYNPTNARIMRQKRFPKTWGSKTNALVTFEFAEGQNLDKVIEECQHCLFEGYPFKLFKAYASRTPSVKSPGSGEGVANGDTQGQIGGDGSGNNVGENVGGKDGNRADAVREGDAGADGAIGGEHGNTKN